MGIAKKIHKEIQRGHKKVFGDKIGGFLNKADLAAQATIGITDKLHPEVTPAEDPESASAAQGTTEGGLETASIQLGRKRKGTSLAKPAAKGTGSAGSVGSGVGLRV